MQGPMKIQIPPWRELHHVQPVNRPPLLPAAQARTLTMEQIDNVVYEHELALECYARQDGELVWGTRCFDPEGPRRIAWAVDEDGIHQIPLPRTLDIAFRTRVCFHCAGYVCTGNGAACAVCDPTPYAR
jgi:hypothetical protein